MDDHAKIIIADVHSSFREGMKLFIEMEGMGEVIAETDSGRGLLSLLDKLNPDLVIIDIEMPGMGGLKTYRKAMAKKPDLKFMVLTMNSVREKYSGLINAGVVDFVLKTAGKQVIENAIKKLIAGESDFSPKKI